jgi:phosphatidylethanolamine/phosphatidyl-N-methylethanolamine N-methyltransferase
MTLSNSGLRRAYARLANVYDLLFGAILQPGRVSAVQSIAGRRGLRVLEVGIGTALTAACYPDEWQITGVDLSLPMLAKARRRIDALGRDRHLRLVLADAARLPFDDGSFDVVVAPYVMSVVPDPMAVIRELRRVCAAPGQIVILNHFLSDHAVGARVEQMLLPITRWIGFRTDLSLAPLLDAAGLEAATVDKVNRPPIWTLVTCRKRPLLEADTITP